MWNDNGVEPALVYLCSSSRFCPYKKDLFQGLQNVCVLAFGESCRFKRPVIKRLWSSS